MKAHWQQFNEREQTAVVVAGLCLVAYLFYAVLFSPLTTAVSSARKHWYEKNSTLMWMRHAQKNYSQEKQPKKVAAGNLLSILTQVLKRASFHRFPYQLAQTASGEIQLNFDEVPYNAFMEWLRVQSMRYTLTVKNLDVTKTNVSGVVKISVIFGVE